MPYEIKHTSGSRPYKITKHGKVVGSSTNEHDAIASMSARQMAEHGIPLTGRKPKR